VLALVALLVVRSILYWQLGSALNWAPRIWLGLIPIAFRSDLFWRIFSYSILSFISTLVIFYLCLLLLSILNNNRSGNDALQNLVRAQLGKLDFLPAIVKLLLPWLVLFVIWCLLNKPFVGLGMLPAPESLTHLIEQGAVASLGIYFVWKYLIVAILLLHLLNSYIYFGNWPFWNFIDNSARQVLKLISWIPLRLAKIDFAPVIAMALVILAAKYGSRGLIEIYQRLPF
jgi:uncharacterized protein YggT (Ycf19 family)